MGQNASLPEGARLNPNWKPRPYPPLPIYAENGTVLYTSEELAALVLPPSPYRPLDPPPLPPLNHEKEKKEAASQQPPVAHLPSCTCSCPGVAAAVAAAAAAAAATQNPVETGPAPPVAQPKKHDRPAKEAKDAAAPKKVTTKPRIAPAPKVKSAAADGKKKEKKEEKQSASKPVEEASREDDDDVDTALEISDTEEEKRRSNRGTWEYVPAAPRAHYPKVRSLDAPATREIARLAVDMVDSQQNLYRAPDEWYEDSPFDPAKPISMADRIKLNRRLRESAAARSASPSEEPKEKKARKTRVSKPRAPRASPATAPVEIASKGEVPYSEGAYQSSSCESDELGTPFHLYMQDVRHAQGTAAGPSSVASAAAAAAEEPQPQPAALPAVIELNESPSDDEDEDEDF